MSSDGGWDYEPPNAPEFTLWDFLISVAIGAVIALGAVATLLWLKGLTA